MVGIALTDNIVANQRQQQSAGPKRVGQINTFGFGHGVADASHSDNIDKSGEGEVDISAVSSIKPE